LDDYNARLYDPRLGRFLSVDPLIGHPESTQGINPYSYVENNPLSRTDPTGEMMTEWQSQEMMSMPTGMAINELSAELGDLQKSGVISNNEALAGQSVLHQAAPGNSLVSGNLQKAQFIASNVGFDVDKHSSTSGDSANLAGGKASQNSHAEYLEQHPEARQKIFDSTLSYLKAHGMLGGTKPQFLNQFYAGESDVSGAGKGTSVRDLPHYSSYAKLQKFLLDNPGYQELYGRSQSDGEVYIFAGATLGTTFPSLPVAGVGHIFDITLNSQQLTEFTILHELGHLQGLKTSESLAPEWDANKYAIDEMRGLGDWPY
ncbi:MAG: RHS repeat-associated core domain-containing protein, partial [Ktedonobacteraceae bacterium]